MASRIGNMTREWRCFRIARTQRQRPADILGDNAEQQPFQRAVAEFSQQRCGGLLQVDELRILQALLFATSSGSRCPG